MKKKVKKIPKYNIGTISANVLDNAMAGRFQTPSASSLGTNQDMASMYAHKNAISNTTVSEQKSGFLPSGIATASNKMLMNTLGIEDNSREGVTLNAAAQGSDIGGSIMPGWGHLIGGVAGGLVGSFKQGSVDPNTGEITYGGIFGRSDHSLRSEANRIKNNIRAKTMTQGIQADYYNNPNVQTQPILAAEGGIIPNDEILVGVTAGEVYKDSNTGEWGVVKGKGMNSKKPKQDDAEEMIIPEGSTIINKHKDYIYSEWGDRTGADIMRPLTKPIKTTGKYAEGTKAAIDAIGKKVLRKQELRKQELHQGEIKNKYSKGTPYVQLGKDPIAKLEEELFKPQTPKVEGKDRRWVYHLAKAGETMSDYLPMASALLKNYDYQRVQPRIGRNHNIPIDYNINDILVDNQQAHAINNYNISQMGGSTGAYLAAAGQSASNLAKANSKARIYQKNKQNELIARNIAQLNDWERYANNQLWTADVATAQNQGMAQQMRDQAIKDAYEYQTGRRNDRWKLSMLEPLFKYAVDDNIWKNFKIA